MNENTSISTGMHAAQHTKQITPLHIHNETATIWQCWATAAEHGDQNMRALIFHALPPELYHLLNRGHMMLHYHNQIGAYNCYTRFLAHYKGWRRTNPAPAFSRPL